MPGLFFGQRARRAAAGYASESVIRTNYRRYYYLVMVNSPVQKISSFFLLLFLFPLSVFSQATANEPGGYRHITVREGLPSSEVYQIFQDRRGYVWMSTDAGVCRYNGYNFQSFTTREGLTDNTVFRLKEDVNGKIWAQGFSGGLSYFDGKKFIPIAANDSLIILYANGQKNSFCMETDEAGGITVGGLFINGLFRVGPEDNYQSLHKVRPEGVNDSLEMIWLAKMNNKIYYVALSESGYRSTIFHNGIITEMKFDVPHGVPISHQSVLLHDGRILFSFFNELYLVGQNGEISHTVFPSSIVNLREDKEGNVWITLFFGGAYLFPGGDLHAE